MNPLINLQVELLLQVCYLFLYELLIELCLLDLVTENIGVKFSVGSICMRILSLLIIQSLLLHDAELQILILGLKIHELVDQVVLALEVLEDLILVVYKAILLLLVLVELLDWLLHRGDVFLNQLLLELDYLILEPIDQLIVLGHMMFNLILVFSHDSLEVFGSIGVL